MTGRDLSSSKSPHAQVPLVASSSSMTSHPTSNQHHPHTFTRQADGIYLEISQTHAIHSAAVMATSTSDQPITNGVHAAPSKPLELAFTLPSNPHTKLHLQLTVHATTILLFVTTTTPENSSQATPLGSFVYALPDRYNPSQPLSTAVYSITHTLDFTQRLAKLLARKTGRACYVGNSASFRDSVQGGTVEEEMEAFGAIVKVVMGEIGKADG